MIIIAHIHTQFPEKFGIPRQSGLVAEATGTIVMEPEFRNPDAFRGIEEFSYLWLLWESPKRSRIRFMQRLHRRDWVGRSAAVCSQRDLRSGRIRSDYPV